MEEVELMATFVLVHEAWHGAWCWRKITPLLRGQGHEVFTPTLTGLGERSHLANPLIGLETHIRDVVNVLTYEDLSEVILVGHSNGGTLITAVADRVSERLAHLVYLDAFVPEDGQATIDLTTINFPREAWEARVRTEGYGWLVPSLQPLPWDEFVRDVWLVTDETDVGWWSASAQRRSRRSPTRCGAPIRRPRRCRAPTFAVCRTTAQRSIALGRQLEAPQGGAIASWRVATNRSSRIRASWPTCC